MKGRDAFDIDKFLFEFEAKVGIEKFKHLRKFFLGVLFYHLEVIDKGQSLFELISLSKNYTKFSNQQKELAYLTFLFFKKYSKSFNNLTLDKIELVKNSILDLYLSKESGIIDNSSLAIFNDLGISVSHNNNWESFKCQVISITKKEYKNKHYLVLECLYDIQHIYIQCFDEWNDLDEYTYINDEIYCTNITQIDDYRYKTNSHSIITLKPTILIDVSELSSFYSYQYNKLLLHRIKRYLPSYTSLKMFRGNFINTAFDNYINNKSLDMQHIFNLTYKERPLQAYYAIEINNENGISGKEFLESVENDINLLSKLELKANYEYKVEEAYISEQFGLSGRLDLSIYDKITDKKIVIELKSSSVPNSVSLINSRGVRFNTKAWENHFAQICCYYLLLDPFESTNLEAYLLYLRYDSKVDYSNIEILNEIAIANQNRKDLVKFRNRLIHSSSLLIDKSTFDFSQANGLKGYEANDLEHFRLFLKGLNELENELFVLFSNFAIIEREEIESSSKTNSISLIEIIEEECDYNLGHLTVNLITQNDNFRQGESVIIKYNIDASSNLPIFKANIKDFVNDKLVLSLRNKHISSSEFENSKQYYLIKDKYGSKSNLIEQGLYFLLSSERKEIILGLTKPGINKTIELEAPKDLNKYQAKIYKEAIQTKDYYLIQGPPGTGKTSYVLKSLLSYYYYNTDINILLVSYTNRSLDEICKAAIKSIGSDNLIRLGTKESSEYPELLLSNIVADATYKEFRFKFNSTRVICATVSQVTSNWELLKSKHFSLLIADEASQISEFTMFGILAQVDKFILIGDEKQLPAISQVPPEKLIINSPLLKELYYETFSSSIFERLIKLAKRNNYEKGIVGLLKEQSRMNEELLNLTNKLFYSNELKLSNNKLHSELYIENKSLICNSHLIFIDCEASSVSKSNIHEVAMIEKLIKTIKTYKLNNKSIGIISPYKNQCSLISNIINDESITVDTIERYQGSERDIIILSLTIANIEMLELSTSITKIDDLEIDRKLNVAITRAKEQLIILGNSEIMNKSKLYSKMLDIISKNGLILNSSELI